MTALLEAGNDFSHLHLGLNFSKQHTNISITFILQFPLKFSFKIVKLQSNNIISGLKIIWLSYFDEELDKSVTQTDIKDIENQIKHFTFNIDPFRNLQLYLHWICIFRGWTPALYILQTY